MQAKLSAEIVCEDEEEIKRAKEMLSESGFEVILDQAKIERPLSELPLKAFEFDERGFTLLRVDPDSIKFSDSKERSALTETPTQKRILSAVLENPESTIEEVAEIADASKSHTKHILGSATVEKAKEITSVEEVEDADYSVSWGELIGRAESEKEERVYREPGEDTREYEVLQALIKEAPISASSLETYPDIDPQMNVNASLHRLEKWMMVEGNDSSSFGNSTQFYVTSLGEALLQRRGDWVENERNAMCKEDLGDLTRRDTDAQATADD